MEITFGFKPGWLYFVCFFDGKDVFVKPGELFCLFFGLEKPVLFQTQLGICFFLNWKNSNASCLFGSTCWLKTCKTQTHHAFLDQLVG